MKKVKYITDFMLDLYHLDALSDKERKMIKTELSKNDELRSRYNELVKEDQKIREYYSLNSLNDSRSVKEKNDNVSNIINFPKNKKRINTGIVIASAAAVLIVLFISIYFYIGRSANNVNDNSLTQGTEYEQLLAYINEYYDGFFYDMSEMKDTSFSDWDYFKFNDPQELIDRGLVVIDGYQRILTIPEGTISIDHNEYSSYSFTDIIISNGVEEINSSAFSDNNIRSIILPESVTSISGYAFAGNPLFSITIGGNVLINGDSFPGNFSVVYDWYGKTAGTYTRSSDDSIKIESFQWVKQSDSD